MEANQVEYEPQRKRIYTLSNAISVLRIPVAAGIIWVHYKNNQSVNSLVWVLVVSGILSDYLDGFIARKLNQVSDLGKALDPICDKIAVAALFVYVVWLGRIPLWFLGVIVARDVLIAGLSLRIKQIRGQMPMAIYSGKISINVVVLYWCIAFFAPSASGWLQATMIASLIVMAYSLFDYIKRYRTIAQQQDFA